MACNNIVWTSLGTNYAHEHIDQGIRMGESTVMLSTFATLSVNSAKQLAAQRDRPFAEFTLSGSEGLRVTV